MQTQNEKIIASPKDLNLLKEKLQMSFLGKRIISVCAGTGCKAYSSDDIYNIMENELSEIQRTNPEKVKNILLKKTGCHGFCENGPIITIHPEGICYVKSKVEDAREIFEKTVDGAIVTRLLYRDEDGPSRWQLWSAHKCPCRRSPMRQSSPGVSSNRREKSAKRRLSPTQIS